MAGGERRCFAREPEEVSEIEKSPSCVRDSIYVCWLVVGLWLSHYDYLRDFSRAFIQITASLVYTAGSV